MENLPEIKKPAAVALYNPKPGTKAVEVRRELIKYPEVAKALNTVEKYIVVASTKIPISEIDDKTLVEKFRQMLRYIAMDVGFIIPTNPDDWAYMQTRLLDIIKRYFPQLTLSEIKLAFELATTGELDDYLPKDSQGNPDKKHYQQFNAEYFSKILNAYKRKQNAVVDKAFKALPKPENNNPETLRYYANMISKRNREIYLRYKYTGVLDFGFCGEKFCFDWLDKIGLTEEIQETPDDRKEALNRYLQRVAKGMVNKYEAYHVRRNGTQSPEIDFTAYEIARRKEIKRTFDRMIDAELDIDNYLIFQ